MSNLVTLPEALVIDPRLAISSQKKVVIRRGSTRTNSVNQSANSVSNSNITYNVVLNNAQSTLIDPFMYQDVVVRCAVSATGLGSQTVQSYLNNNFCLRQYPLASVTSSCSVAINQVTVSSSPSQFIHQLSQFQEFLSGSGQAKMQSLVPIQPDMCTDYSQTVGSLKRPQNTYFAGSDLYSEPRGTFNSLFETTTNGTGTWVFTVKLREPFFNSLLEYDPGKESEALAYVNQLQITLNMLSYLERIFSWDATTCPNITGVTVDILSAELHMQWLQAPVEMRMPDMTIRSYVNLSVNQTRLQPFIAGESRVVNSQTYSVPQIPKKIWVYCAESESEVNVPFGSTKADFNFAIKNIRIDFSNSSNLLSNYTTADLYNVCQAQEGSIMSFCQSQNFSGSVLCIDTCKLLQLSEDEAPGISGQFKLDLSCEVKNIAGRSVTPNLFVVWGIDNLFITEKIGTSTTNNNYITRDMVLKAASLTPVPGAFDHGFGDIYGGSFWDSVKRFAAPIWNFVKDNKLISKSAQAIPQLQQFAPVLQNLGLGGKMTNKRAMAASRASLRN